VLGERWDLAVGGGNPSLIKPKLCKVLGGSLPFDVTDHPASHPKEEIWFDGKLNPPEALPRAFLFQLLVHMDARAVRESRQNEVVTEKLRGESFDSHKSAYQAQSACLLIWAGSGGRIAPLWGLNMKLSNSPVRKARRRQRFFRARLCMKFRGIVPSSNTVVEDRFLVDFLNQQRKRVQEALFERVAVI